MKIIAIRHGETDINASGLLQGQQIDAPLNEKGKEQARQAAEKLPGDIDIIISSPLVRATQTARILNERFKKEAMSVDNRLLERDFGEFEGLPMNDFCVDIDDCPFENLTIYADESLTKKREININALRRYSDNVPTPGGECMHDVVARVFGFLDNVIKKYRGKNILLCTHSHVIRPIIWYFNGLPTKENEEDITTANCAFYEFEVTPEQIARVADTIDESEKHQGLLTGTLIVEFTHKDGWTYKGDWQDGYKMQGQGRFTEPTGNYYDGEWVKGVRCGYGVYMYPDGENYVGQWKDNCRHGYGKYTFVSGKVWEGEWIEDEFIMEKK